MSNIVYRMQNAGYRICCLYGKCIKEQISSIRNLSSKGVTLIELIVTVAIIGILTTALAFSFQGWISEYNIERQIKEIHIDLMNMRARAMHRDRMHFIDLTALQYTVYEDTNVIPNGDGIANPANDTQVSQVNLDPRYPVIWSDPADNRIQFNLKGLSSDDKTICSNTAANADYNCILITETRINLGQLTVPILNGGACDVANCVSR